MNKMKVAPAFKFGANGNTLSAKDLENLNEAVNYRVGEFTTKTVPQMISRMKQKYFTEVKTDLEIIGSSFTTWTRPSAWPDLDSLNLQQSGSDYIYMTYDANKGKFQWRSKSFKYEFFWDILFNTSIIN